MGQSKAFKPVAVVVEDDALQSSRAAMLLEEADFEVIECGSGEKALAAIKRKAARVSLVFTDLVLGHGMDGLDLATQVRQRCPQATVVITSGNVSGRNGQLAAEMYFMPKPWLPLNLLMAAERAKSAIMATAPADAGNQERAH